MDTVERATLTSWMDLDAEGCLGPTEQTRLEDHLSRLRERSPEDARSLEAERDCWTALHRALADDRTPVRPSFHDDVMASIDPTLWQRDRSGAWKLPLAMMLVFALGAAWSLGSVGVDHPIIGTGGAILDFLQTTALAGAGMTVAGWRGVGMGLEELFAGSPRSIVALGILVVFLNLLFFSLLRRRLHPVTESAALESPALEAPGEGDRVP